MEKKYKLITYAIKEAMKHTTSSPETVKEINKINVVMESMDKDIKYIKKGQDDLKKDMKESLEKLESTIKGCNKKYAAKWVQTSMSFLIGALVLASLYTIFDAVGLAR